MIRNWRLGVLDNMLMAESDRMTHVFPEHFHEEYTIGVATSGLQQFDLPGSSFLVEPHSFILINPRQMHAHFPLNDIGWSHKSMYVTSAVVARIRKPEERFFAQPLLKDPLLYTTYQRLHASREEASEEELLGLIAAIFETAAKEALSLQEDSVLGGGPDEVAAIKEFLAQNLESKLQLDNLAGRFGLDKFRLIRLFKKHAGVTPNAYLMILRVEKARRLLSEGETIVSAALEAGFYDQSHFHHTFHHYTGMTPGQYRQQCNILQD